MSAGLTVVLITRDEEKAIAAALDSVSWADEVVVLDSGSTDRTVEIARARGAKVTVSADWPGFGPQKNRALGEATRDWVLSLDADERVTPELRDEIQAIVAGKGNHDAYELPRLSSYCGRFMRHGGWWPDRVTRLFRRGKARFSDDLVHERVVVQGTTGRLEGRLLHEAFDDLEEVLDKVNQYSSAGARMGHAAGRRGSLTRAVLHGVWTFVRTYFLQAGFLDGRRGFMLAVSNAEGTYYRYLKLMLLGERL
ncbi:MAG: glycosyltransferase family 2 protein [Burkholderiales bacterium]|nr:glycosyltransferase family 2 protein [Burkholderiales bacterium]